MRRDSCPFHSRQGSQNMRNRCPGYNTALSVGNYSIQTEGFLYAVRQILQTSDQPFNNICSLVLEQPCFWLHSSIRFCLCVHNKAPLSHQSNGASVSWDVTSLFHISGCSITLHICSPVFILQYVSFVITSHPKRYSIKKLEEAKCFSAICSCLYLSSKDL